RAYSRGHERPLSDDELRGTTVSADGETVLREGTAAGVIAAGVARAGLNTPSRRLEFYSTAPSGGGWPEHADPRYVPGHVYWRALARGGGGLCEGMGGSRSARSVVRIARGGGRYTMKEVHGAQPFASDGPDSARVWWTNIGVHQNLTFPVQPDPVSGMHCWHQRVTVEKAGPDDMYGDIFVDTDKSHEIYKEWLAMTRPAPGPDGLRRPLWFDRPLRPAPATYKL